MKVKIIKEEVEKEIKQNLIRAFVTARNTGNIQQLIQTIKAIGIQDPLLAINFLTKDEVDSQFLINCTELHNDMARELGQSDRQKAVDAFPRFPDTRMGVDRVPRGNKEVDPIIDPRRTAKNLKGGVSESKMKITKEYIKQIISEEVNKILEGEEEDEEFDEDTEEFQKWPKGKDIEPEDVGEKSDED